MAVRILVVDDEDTVCRLLGRILKPPQFEVVKAHSPDDARKLLALKPPQLVILDIGLGAHSGEVFCHSLHADPATTGIPVLILTARDLPEIADSPLANCAQDLLHKPFDVAELLFHVEALLKQASFETRRFNPSSSR